MPVTVLILAKFVIDKPVTLLIYELLLDALQTLNLDNKKPFFREKLLLSNCFGIYQTGE